MRFKTIIDERFEDYKKPSMFVGTISCGGKCCIEKNLPLSICQNDEWRSCFIIDIPDEEICRRYLSNHITSAIVIGGLEPFEQTDEIIEFINTLRNDFNCDDDVVIYTGYYPDEIEAAVVALKKYPNIIIKFGRYIPNKPHKYDEVLGVELSSDNQYTLKIS